MLEKFVYTTLRDIFADGFAEIEAHDERVDSIFLNKDDFKRLKIAIGPECRGKKSKDSGVLGSLWGATIYRSKREEIIFVSKERSVTPKSFRKRVSKYVWMQKTVKLH